MFGNQTNQFSAAPKVLKPRFKDPYGHSEE